MNASSRVGKATPLASLGRNDSNLTRKVSLHRLIACSQSLTAPSSISLAVNAIQAGNASNSTRKVVGAYTSSGAASADSQP
ncbi:MAG: hypothetical protein ACK56W_10420 [Pirellula sp.]|nr:hypothetical protein [Pirellula sp.]